MSQLLLGLGDALRPDVILFVFVGVLLGYVVGVLPGLNRPAALAIAVPLSYYMTPLSAVAWKSRWRPNTGSRRTSRAPSSACPR